MKNILRFLLGCSLLAACESPKMKLRAPEASVTQDSSSTNLMDTAKADSTKIALKN